MKRCLAAFAAAPFVCLAASNLVPGGDFAGDGGRIGWCRTELGAFSVFTEEATWNRCGRLQVKETITNGTRIVRSAAVTIGRDGDRNGFIVKPGTTYDFSVDLRGGVSSASVRAITWHGDDYWRDRKTVDTRPKLRGLRLTGEWSTFKGSFRTPDNASRAALQIAIWSSSEMKSGLFPDGSFVLFDNIKVTESYRNIDAAQPADFQVPRRKAVCTGESFSDFLDLKSGAPVSGADTEVRTGTDGGAFVFEVLCREQGKVVAGNAKSPWSGDCAEIWFGPAGPGRFSTQIAAGNGGAKYLAVNGKAVDASAVDVEASSDESSWRVKVRVPFETMGWKAGPHDGDAIAFNVGRYRSAARGNLTWSRLATGFNDTANYGELVCGSYSAALKKKYGTDRACATRDEYEKLVAEAETAAVNAKFARFRDRTFTAAPVPVASDYSIPFLPEEIFDPPEKISLTAAVNERKSLPLAIANMSARHEEYVVLLETEEDRNRGRRGLKGLPEDRVKSRRALRMKDARGANPTLRYDPLPEAGDVLVVDVPPKEAGLVWFDFDLEGVHPGIYPGRLRVIPLGGRGSFSSKSGGYHDIHYEGDMLTVPVSLEVRPIVLPKRAAIPSEFFMGALSKEAFASQAALGGERFLLSPWNFAYERNADGNLDLSRPCAEAVKLKKSIADQLAWGAELGFRTRFLVCYSAVHAFHALYNPKKDPETSRRLWPQYILGVKKLMNECGVDDSGYAIETYDEPPADDYKGIRGFHDMAKAVAPTVRLEITLGCRRMKIEELRSLSEVTDEWIVWDSHFGNEGLREFFLSERRLGKPVGHYECDTSPRAELYSYYRGKAWFGERHGLSSNAMYQFYDLSGGVGARDFKVATSGGIAFIVHGRVVPTARYMAFREGVTDMKYFEALRKAAGSDPEVAAFLKEAPLRMLDSIRYDPAGADRLRERAAQMILSRQAR